MHHSSYQASTRTRRGNASFLERRSITTKVVIFTSFISILVFFLQGTIPSLIPNLALTPSEILHGQKIWTLFTHIFVHGNFVHLFANMLTFFFIGLFVERLIGQKRFLFFYLIAGIAAGGIFTLFAWLGSTTGLTSVFGAMDIPGVGASGAIFGLLGILAVIIPNKKIMLALGPLLLFVVSAIIEKSTPNPTVAGAVSTVISILMFLLIYAFFNPYSKLHKWSIPLNLPMWAAPIIAILPFMALGLYVETSIGNTAHLGGLLIGLLYGFYLRNRYKKKVLLLNRIIQ